MNNVFNELNRQPWYFKNSVCDDCLYFGDTTTKLVKRIEDDGICFCEKHWKDYQNNMLKSGYKVEPFYEQ